MIHYYLFSYCPRPMEANKKIDANPNSFAIILRLADELVFRIQHYQCWQIPWFPELNIASIYKQVDFWNSALLDFYKIEESMNSALLIFRRMKILEKLHCQFPWLFTQYEMNQRIYITNRQCCFSESARSVNTSNAVFPKTSDLPTPAMLFSRNASYVDFRNAVFG